MLWSDHLEIHETS